MKATLLAIVLVWAMAVGAQTPTPPQVQAVRSGHAVRNRLPGPIIKDPAEYDAYVNAVLQSDPVSKIGSLQAFLVQYPNSVMKPNVLGLIAATNKMMGSRFPLSKSTR
jgi:hypothetical protein